MADLRNYLVFSVGEDKLDIIVDIIPATSETMALKIAKRSGREADYAVDRDTVEWWLELLNESPQVYKKGLRELIGLS